MKEVLRKLKLIDSLYTELEMQRSDFVNNLRTQVDNKSIGLFTDPLEVFSSNKKEYKGKVTYDGFTIQKRRKIFDTNMNMAIATGTYRQKDNLLIIKTEINSLTGMMISFYIFCLIFYTVFIVLMLTANDFGGDGPGIFWPFILVHGALMFGLPYFMMRRSTQKMKYDLEREFFYLTK